MRGAALWQVVLLVLAITAPVFAWGRKASTDKKSDSKIPVIIIADVGIDDAGALLLAVGSPALNVLGVVSSFGCHKDPRVTARNAHALLAAANRTDVPIFLGASFPIGLNGPLQNDGTHFHGAEGLGGLLGLGEDVDQTCNSASVSTDVGGAEFIVERARSMAGEVHLLCFSPLTNIAHAVCTHVHQHEGVPTAISALFGVKCLVDGYKITFGGPNAYTGSPFDAEKNFAISRMIEAVGGIVQTYPIWDLRMTSLAFPIFIGFVQSAAFLALFGNRYKKGRWCC